MGGHSWWLFGNIEGGIFSSNLLQSDGDLYSDDAMTTYTEGKRDIAEENKRLRDEVSQLESDFESLQQENDSIKEVQHYIW